MKLLDRLICFAGSLAFIAFALTIGLAHDNHVMTYGRFETWQFVLIITCIIASFASSIGCMILAAKD